MFDRRRQAGQKVLPLYDAHGGVRVGSKRRRARLGTEASLRAEKQFSSEQMIKQTLEAYSRSVDMPLLKDTDHPNVPD